MGLNAGYDNQPEVYDQLRHCWLNERRALFLCNALAAHGRVSNVIEIGSGTGWLLKRLAAEFPNTAFWGVEPLPGYVEFARKGQGPSNVTFLNGLAETMDQLDLPMADAVLSNDVLHHVAHLEGAVTAVSRRAAANCRWWSIEPNWLNAYSFLRAVTTSGERVFWPWTFARVMRSHGWLRRSRGHLFLIPPFVRDPSAWMRRAEVPLERVPVLAGGVYAEFELTGSRQC